jgi:hypothetical protein
MKKHKHKNPPKRYDKNKKDNPKDTPAQERAERKKGIPT